MSRGARVIRVSGRDRVHWLNGMLSNDIGALAPGPSASGCYALLLTPKARITADFHVLLPLSARQNLKSLLQPDCQRPR